MKHSEALRLTNLLLISLIKARSITAETVEKINGCTSTEILYTLTPWLYGDQGMALIKSLSNCVDREKVTGMEFYNFMTIIHVLDETVGVMASVIANTAFPQPDMKWAMGFDKEE